MNLFCIEIICWCDFLGFPNSWLLITKGVKRFLTSTCLMDKSNKNNFSLHVFIKNKIYSSLEGRVYILKLNAVVTCICMVCHTCIQCNSSFNANFCSFSLVESPPTNSGLLMHNVLQVCLAANNILLMHKWNHAFLLLVITLVWKCRLLCFPKIFIKNKLGGQN